MISNDWRSQIFEKKSDPKLGFLKFGSLVFLKIAYNDNLQQYLTSSRRKIHEKKFWGPNLDQRGQNRAWN